ncbi:MAG: GEVED domain-containing protein [Thermoanaerobaculia bacterium]
MKEKSCSPARYALNVTASGVTRSTSGSRPTAGALSVAAWAMLLLFSGGVTTAELILAPYPAPGGNSYSNDGGHAGRAGALESQYTGFDLSASEKLYFAMGQWSPSFIPDGPECDMDGTPDTLTFDSGSSNLGSGIAVWTGSTTLTWVSGGGYVDTVIDTRFTQTVTDLADSPLALTAAATIPEMPTAVGGVLEVAGGFKSIWFLEARAPDTGLFEPAHDMFDRLNTQGQIHYNVGGGFYYTIIDCGDVPDPTYPVLVASDGARHEMKSGFFLGACVDAEVEGTPTSGATGDDSATGSEAFGTCAVAGADEDGVSFTTTVELGADTTGANLQVIASGLGFLNAWIDFNADGDWDDADEQIFTNGLLAAGTNTPSFTSFAEAVPGPTYARFRYNSAGGLSSDGRADDGEVEDYAVTIVPTDDLDLSSRLENSQRTFWACNSIAAGDTFEVLATGDIAFHGGNLISLRNGFVVRESGSFVVQLGSVPGCPP